MRANRNGAGSARAGFTLIELVVVLLLAGIAITLVGPSIISRPGNSATLLQQSVNTARNAALDLSQSVQLEIKSDGSWLVAVPKTGRVLNTGSGLPTSSSLRLNVSPLGDCLHFAGNGNYSIDPLTCRIVQVTQ